MSTARRKSAHDPARLLQAVLGDVLEQSAFLLTAPAQPLVGWRVQEPIHAVVAFSGCAMGWLQLRMPRALLASLTADRLALRAAEPLACSPGAVLCELLRGVAEQLLPLYFETHRSYELGPSTLPDTIPDAPDAALRCQVMRVTEAAQPIEAELVVLREGGS